MNEEQKSSPHKNAILFQYVLLLFCVYLGFLGLMGKPIAKYKAKNPKNIMQGCLYHTGVNFKGVLMGRINNEDENPLGDMHIDSFPQEQSKKEFLFPIVIFIVIR